jgi:hypothetical protein
VWWYTLVILTLRRLRQKDFKFRPAWATKQDPVSKKNCFEKKLYILKNIKSLLPLLTGSLSPKILKKGILEFIHSSI